MPILVENRLTAMSDVEILQEYVDKCKNFIDPFLFQEMCNRGLISRGDYYRDIEKRIMAAMAAQSVETVV